MRALRWSALAVLVSLAGTLAAAEPTDTRFAIAIAQGVTTYEAPGVFNAKSTFNLPILSPHRILDEKAAGGKTWYLIRRSSGQGSGWVDSRAVEVWQSRHALQPGAMDGEIPGYCSWLDVERAVVGGESKPCMRYTPGMMRLTGSRAPFPVVDVRSIRPTAQNSQVYMEVLVPTIYSNIVPFKETQSGSVTSGLSAAGTLEVVVLIDATGSMSEEIEAVASAVNDVVSRVTKVKELNSRFLVLAYRDTNKTDQETCRAMEASSGDGPLAFGSAEQAHTFLTRLQACQGGDDKEALWDAFYLLKSLKVQPGANRALFLVGDAPALDKTRGGTWFGVNVPKDLTSTQVFAEMRQTIGESTTFVALLVNDPRRRYDLTRTAEQVLQGFNFFRKEVFDEKFGEKTDSYKDIVRKVSQKTSDTIISALGTTEDMYKAVEGCSKQVYTGEGQAKVVPFCGLPTEHTTDEDLASRVRDIVQNPTLDQVVVRRLWIPKWQTLNDVALITLGEAPKLVKALDELSRATESGKGCRTTAPKTWYSVLEILVPGDKWQQNNDSVFSQPSVSDALHKYWKIEVGSGSSVINLTPSQLSALTADDCRELGERLKRSAGELRRHQALNQNLQYLWIPFQVLP